jgi:Spy/CpxP family protein refolding chaperone
MRRRTLGCAMVFALFGLMVAASALPQPPGQSQPPFKWWQSEKFKAALNLTAEQSSRAEEVYQTVLPKLRAGKEELERREKRLSQLLANDGASEPDVMHQIDEVERARSELSKTRTVMLIRMRRVLSPDQREKMKALHEQWEKEQREHKEREPRR